ncbi:MAG: FmdE family protein [Anaerolineales bacterium]
MSQVVTRHLPMEVEYFDALLEHSARMHRHLCPRQVLGVRMGLLAGRILGLDLPQTGKRLITIVETDGCAADAVSVATNCWVGRRTLRVEDHGKVAATFADSESGEAVRIVPRRSARWLARKHAPEAMNKWQAYLLGYRQISSQELFKTRPVVLNDPLEWIISRPGMRIDCDACGEEIINERELAVNGHVLCRACAGESYYSHIKAESARAAGPRARER